LITFVNPGGYPAGNYGARLTPDGEIVPLEPGQISFTRTNNNMVLTWPEGYALFSAPEVDGPYEPVPDATSPYTVLFTDPQRFFILRPAQ
ncbi:MAG TPA: hypothetical protein VFC26_15160, partial [Verrucomicrobiae bacterium]|nr:hypothetical protein [Verrucomicrobiae bacterium]